MAKQRQTRSGSPSTNRSQPNKKKIKNPSIKKSPSPSSLGQTSDTPGKAGRKPLFSREELLNVSEELRQGTSYELQDYLRGILRQKGTYSKEQLQNMVQLEYVSRIKPKILKLKKEDTSKEKILLESPSFQSTPKHNQRNFNEISPKSEGGKEPGLSPSFLGSTNNNIHENSEDRNSHRYCDSSEAERAREIRELSLSVSPLDLSNFQGTLGTQRVECQHASACELLYGQNSMYSSSLPNSQSYQSPLHIHNGKGDSPELLKSIGLDNPKGFIQQVDKNLEQQSSYSSTNEELSWHENPSSSKDTSYDSKENQLETDFSRIFHSPNSKILIREPFDIQEFFENRPINFLLESLMTKAQFPEEGIQTSKDIGSFSENSSYLEHKRYQS